jgi:hypothetical protein
LLRLHNICTHPALASSLQDDHHTAAAAAVKPWAAALLKLHCTKAGRTSNCGSRTTSSDAGDAGDSVAGRPPQQHAWADCWAQLQAAAHSSLARMTKVNMKRLYSGLLCSNSHAQSRFGCFRRCCETCLVSLRLSAGIC